MSFIDTITNDFGVAIKARENGRHIVFGYLGMPGIGKTQVIHSVAKNNGYEVWSALNLSAATPMDVAIKMPNVDEGCFETLPSDDFPWSHVVGDRKILLFIDEVTNGSTDVIKSIQRLINERKLGKYVLGENVIVMVAGNRQSDKSGSGNLTTAMYNRITWRNIHWTTQDSDVAIEYIVRKYADESQEAKEFLSLVEAYFARSPIMEKDFTDAVAKIGKEPFVQWCSPRSLEALVCRVAVSGWKLPLVTDMAGDIGVGRATELYTFAGLVNEIDKYETIISDPEGAKLPEKPEVQYAAISMLAARVTKDDFASVWKYVTRLGEVTMRAVFLRMAVKHAPEIRLTKTFGDLYKTDKELMKAIAAAF